MAAFFFCLRALANFHATMTVFPRFKFSHQTVTSRTTAAAPLHRAHRPHAIVPGRFPVLVAALLAVLALQSCTPYAALTPTGTHMMSHREMGASRWDGLTLHTSASSRVLFQDGGWELTWTGVRGHARIEADGVPAVEMDTTIAYADIAATATGSGRTASMSQFLLTILGVILVIGLAAIVLYAAFLATDR